MALSGGLAAAVPAFSVLAFAVPALADIPPAAGTWDPRLFSQGIMPRASAIAVSGESVFVAGQFSPPDPNLSVWNSSTGTWSKLPGEIEGGAVNELAVFGGQLYAAGTFESIDGQAYPGLARWDGQAWSGLGDDVAGYSYGYRFEVMDGALYVYGAKQGGGLTFSRVGRWDGNAWSKPIFDSASLVKALITDDAIYASRTGLSDHTMERFDGTSWVSMDTSYASSLKPQPFWLVIFQGQLYAAGSFSRLTPTSISFIARWNGTDWEQVGEGLPEPVRQMKATDDALYVSTSAINDYYEKGTVRAWDGSQWTVIGVPAWAPGAYREINATTVADGKFYIAGYFNTVGGRRAPNAAWWDFEEQAWQPVRDESARGLDSFVFSLAAGQSGVYAGGGFTTAGDTPLGRIARWDGSGWSPLGEGGAVRIDDMAVTGKKVFAIGSWLRDGNEKTGVSRWNGTSWGPVRPLDRYSAITAAHGRLYAAGAFHPDGGLPTALAIWDGARWEYPPTSVTGLIQAIAVTANGDLFLGGYISNVNGVPVSLVTRWDGEHWSALGEFDHGIVNAIVTRGDAIYVGGGFDSVSDIPAHGIAKWENGVWSALGDVDCDTQRLAIDQNHLHADCGIYDAAIDDYARTLLRWDGQAWEEIGDRPESVFAMTARGGQVFVGGGFLSVDGVASPYAARWTPCDVEAQSCFAIESTTTTTLDTTTTSLSTTTTVLPPTTTSTTATSTSTTSSSTTLLDSKGCGDVDSDGDHDTTDALLLLRAALGLDLCPLSYCDVNGSGAVTVVDALNILRAAVGLAVTLLCPES